MRRTVTTLALVGAAAYLLGRRSAGSDGSGPDYTAYQRAAILWTFPRVTKVRRTVRKRVRDARR